MLGEPLGTAGARVPCRHWCHVQQVRRKWKAKLNHASRNQSLFLVQRRDRLEKARERSWKQDLRVCSGSCICRGQEVSRTIAQRYQATSTQQELPSARGRLQDGRKSNFSHCTLVEQGEFESAYGRRGGQATRDAAGSW